MRFSFAPSAVVVLASLVACEAPPEPSGPSFNEAAVDEPGPTPELGHLEVGWDRDTTDEVTVELDDGRVVFVELPDGGTATSIVAPFGVTLAARSNLDLYVGLVGSDEDVPDFLVANTDPWIVDEIEAIGPQFEEIVEVEEDPQLANALIYRSNCSHAAFHDWWVRYELSPPYAAHNWNWAYYQYRNDRVDLPFAKWGNVFRSHLCNREDAAAYHSVDANDFAVWLYQHVGRGYHGEIRMEQPRGTSWKYLSKGRGSTSDGSGDAMGLAANMAWR